MKYVCKKCGIEYEKLQSLAAHVRSHKLVSVSCPKCNKLIKDKSGLKTHVRNCNGFGVKKPPFICPVCNIKIKSCHEKHLKSCNGYGPRRYKLKPRGKRGGWNKGKTFEELYGEKKAKQLKEEISIRMHLNHNWKSFSEEKKNEIRKKCSKKMFEKYEKGWKSVCGRTKKIEYESYIAGKITLDGTWELLTAIFLDNLEVQWIRNKKRFKYYNTTKGTISTYCPDFYVIDWLSYIEVKGYITDLDFIKWGQFPEKIEIWDEEILNELNILAGVA